MLPLAVFSACAGAAIIAVMVPVRIRFGGDQGRIVIYAVFALVALGVVLLTKVLPVSQEQVTGFFAQLGLPAVMLIAVGAVALLTAAGYLLGVRWIGKKEF